MPTPEAKAYPLANENIHVVFGDACGGGSDSDHGEDSGMGLEANSRAVEVGRGHIFTLEA